MKGCLAIMYNRRAYRRCNVDGEGIIKAESGNIRLQLINISASGALVSVPRMLSINSNYSVRLTFQVYLVQMQFQTEATVISMQEQTGSQYVYEINFHNLDEKYIAELDEIINYSFEEYEAVMNSECLSSLPDPLFDLQPGDRST